MFHVSRYLVIGGVPTSIGILNPHFFAILVVPGITLAAVVGGDRCTAVDIVEAAAGQNSAAVTCIVIFTLRHHIRIHFTLVVGEVVPRPNSGTAACDTTLRYVAPG